MRKTNQELEQIKQKYKADQLWSWSRYNCYKTSPYEFYLKYIANIKEDRNDSIYSISGNICHSIIERLYSKEIEHKNMLEAYEEELFNLKIGEFKYDRSNEEKNTAIADKYEHCIRHFFINHIPITQKVDIERFIIIKVGEYIFQGYIDAVHKEGKDFVVTDWKTSSIYKGDKIQKERGQLLLYAEALRQLGVPLENIKIRWNFLKYVTVETQQANGKVNVREIARNEIGTSLKANVKMWLNKTKRYTDDEVESLLELLADSNDIKCLPEDIRLKYKMSDCCVYIDFTQQDIDDLKEDIINTINEINRKASDYNKTKNEKIWWEEVTDKSSYYFANLCNYSGYLHKPYGEYLEKYKGKNNMSKNDDDDLSWLTGL